MSLPPVLKLREPDWFMRNWKWLVAVAGLVVIVGAFGFVVGLLKMMKSSDAYAGAFARAKRDPNVIEAVGQPIVDGFWFTGNISMSGSSGNADLVIPISGPTGKGTIYTIATKSAGLWHYDQLVVQLDRDNRRIDLSEKSESRTRR